SISYPLSLSLFPHLLLLALLQTIGLYLIYHYYPHRLLLVMLLKRCCLILFGGHLYLQYHSAHFLVSLLQFVSRFLMLGLTHLLLFSHLVLLCHRMLSQTIFYPLMLLLFILLLCYETFIIISLYLTYHYYYLHLILLTFLF